MNTEVHNREIGFEEMRLLLTEAFRRNLVPVPMNMNDARLAAVMCILYPTNNKPYFLLTRRKATLYEHGGEISFPGGSKEDRDRDLRGTALREVKEELGLVISLNDVIGELTAVFTYSSNFVISPFLALVKTRPQVKPISNEVSYVLEVDFNRLLDPSKYIEDDRSSSEKKYPTPYYDYEGEMIWGATAQIINQLVTIILEGTIGP